jgi:toxin ParE1/3/4
VKIVWTKRALEHLKALHAYIAADSEWNAALVATRILEAVELLGQQPELGRVGRRVGTRELMIPKTPFLVVYRVRNGVVRLLAVLHGKQIW